MKILGFLKRKKSNAPQRKFGKSSSIAERRSPYLHKMPDSTKKVRAVSKHRPTFSPPRSLNKASSGGKGKIFLATILSLGLIGFAIYGIFFSDYFLIEKFEMIEEGTPIDNYEKMNEILKKLIGQNLLFVNDEGLIQEIKTAHPEIQKVQVKKIFPATIKIEYDKFPTVANLENVVNGIEKKFLVDSQGFLVEENIDEPDLPHIKIETSEPLMVRSTFLQDPERSVERVTYILNSINLFEEKFGMKVLYAQFYPREREIHLYTEKYFTVLIDMEKDLNRQIEKLKKAQGKLDIYNVPLVYIDLRISGTDTEKVIFKRK